VVSKICWEKSLAGSSPAIGTNFHNKQMSNTNNINLGGGNGCLSLILLILTLTALWFGLPTPWGLFEIDIFPAGIFLNR
jgi:hypothetical protein